MAEFVTGNSPTVTACCVAELVHGELRTSPTRLANASEALEFSRIRVLGFQFLLSRFGREDLSLLLFLIQFAQVRGRNLAGHGYKVYEFIFLMSYSVTIELPGSDHLPC